MTRWRIGGLLLGLMLLTGCSAGTRFAYDHLRTLARWQIGEYVDLEAEQKSAFDREFEALQAWHRRTQLPLYAADLRAAAQLFESGNPPAPALDALRVKLEQHGSDLLNQAQPAVVRLLGQLDDTQVTAILDHQRNDDERQQRKRSGRSAEARRKAALRERIDGVEEWTGPITPAQRQQMTQDLDADIGRGALDPQRREAADARDLEALATLLAHRRDADFDQWLARFGDPVDEAQAAREAASTERNRQRFAAFVQTLNDDQRARIRKRLLGFAEDCAALAAEGRS